MIDPLAHKVRPLKRRGRRKPLSVQVANMYRVLSITLLTMGAVSLMAYLYVNSLKPAKGYTLIQLQNEQAELLSEQRELEHMVIEAQSMIRMEEEVQASGFADDEEITFVEDDNVAQAL